MKYPVIHFYQYHNNLHELNEMSPTVIQFIRISTTIDYMYLTLQISESLAKNISKKQSQNKHLPMRFFDATKLPNVNNQKDCKKFSKVIKLILTL